MTNKYLSRFFDRMKPRMHILKISIFSLNHVIVRFTKIMNNLLKHLKISVLEIGRNFLKKIFYEEYLTRRPTFIKHFFGNFDFQGTVFPKIELNFCWLCS